MDGSPNCTITHIQNGGRQKIRRLYEENLLADSVERIVVPISSSCDDFEVNAIRTIKIVARLASQQANWQTGAATSRKGIEAKISSGDGLIVGRLDRYRWEDGLLVVTDIKTGKTSNQNGKLNRELTMQLMLYAYLLHERFGQWPKSLKIITLRGETIEVPFSPDEAENLAAQMKQRLIETDKSIGEVIEGKRLTNTLASPSPEVCRFCRYRPSCASYWEERQKTPELACASKDGPGRMAAVGRAAFSRLYPHCAELHASGANVSRCFGTARAKPAADLLSATNTH